MFFIGIVVSAVITIPIYYAMSGGGTLGIVVSAIPMFVIVGTERNCKGGLP